MIRPDQECYLLITKEDSYEVTGGWPVNIIMNLLEKYDEIIVVSLYSNTIKYVRLIDNYGEHTWETYKELHFAKDVVKLSS